MKITKLIAVLLSIIIFSSCNNSNSPSITSIMTGDITGYKIFFFKAEKIILSSPSGHTMITAYQGNLKGNATLVEFQFYNLPSGASTIPVGVTSSGIFTISYIANGNPYPITFTSGSINITENSSSKIVGSFNIIGGDIIQGNDVHISNGIFTIAK